MLVFNCEAVAYLSSRQQTPQTKETATGQCGDFAKGELAFVIATNLKGKMYKPAVSGPNKKSEWIKYNSAKYSLV